MRTSGDMIYGYTNKDDIESIRMLYSSVRVHLGLYLCEGFREYIFMYPNQMMLQLSIQAANMYCLFSPLHKVG